MRILPLLTLTALLAASPVIAHDGHVHETHDVAAEDAPVITGFTVSGTTAEGFTVTVAVENFTFVEEGEEAAGPNPGHVHLTINGWDLGMFYAPVFTLEELPFGPHDFRVVLSDPDHADYAIAGRPIAATTTFTVE
jgi:hypothetical protein